MYQSYSTNSFFADDRHHSVLGCSDCDQFSERPPSPIHGFESRQGAPVICRLDLDRRAPRNIESIPGPGRTFPNSHEVDEQQRVETMCTKLGTSA